MLIGAEGFASVAYADEYNSFHPPGGINSSTTIPKVYSDGSTGTLAQIGQMADDSVQQTDKNVANGVPGLDRESNINLPDSHVKTLGGDFTEYLTVAPTEGNVYPNATATNAIQLSGHKLWWGNKAILGRYGTGSNIVNVGDWWITPPETLHLGGQSEHDSAFLNVHCSPYSNSNAGTCAQIMMGAGNVQAQAAGIGPSGDRLYSYDNFDAVALTNQIGDSIPRFIATSNKASNLPYGSDGIDRTPTFTATGANFANPLSTEDSQWLVDHVVDTSIGVHVLTNEVGCSTCAIRTWAGDVVGVTQNTDGLVTGVTVKSGWQIINSGKAPASYVPGQDTVDGSIASIDTIWSNFKYPAIMFAVYTKGFNNYTLCQTSGPKPSGAHGDINYPSGGVANQLRVCEAGEHDLWQADPVDGRAIMHGFTVAYSKLNGAGLPSTDSYNYMSAGANIVAYKMTGEYFTQPFNSPSFIVNGYGGPGYTAGNKSVIFDFSQKNRYQYDTDGGHGYHTFHLSAENVRQNTVFDETTQSQDTGITTNLGVYVDGTMGLNTGTPTGHIEFNGISLWDGIALCGYLKTDKSCGLWMDGDQNINLTHDLRIIGSNNSPALYVYSDANNIAHIAAKSSSTVINIDSGLDIGSSLSAYSLTAGTGGISTIGAVTAANFSASGNITAGGGTSTFGNLKIYGTITAGGQINALNGLIIPFGTPTSSGAACTQGQIEMDTDYIYTCVSKNSWHRVSNGNNW